MSIHHHLPEFIFFTGAPGSRWSGIAQALEQHPDMDTSDRSPHREYRHSQFSGHLGSYFGPAMELDARLDPDYIRSAWLPGRHDSKLVKSHHWAYMLDEITQRFPAAWIVMVLRNDDACDQWWHHAGGFNIRYPSYTWYENDEKMRHEIVRQNRAIKIFASQQNLEWSRFDRRWIAESFGFAPTISGSFEDVLVTILKTR